MNTVIIAIIFFLEMIQYIIIFDVILSWLFLFWIKFKPKFIRDILDPTYKWIKSFIPTRIWAFDFTPIVALLTLIVLREILFMFFPEVRVEVTSFMK